MPKNKVQCIGYNNLLMHLFSSFLSTCIGCFYKNSSEVELSMVLFTFYNVKIGWRVKKGIKFTQLKTSLLNFVKLIIFYLWNVKWLFFLSWNMIQPPPPFITLSIIIAFPVVLPVVDCNNNCRNNLMPCSHQRFFKSQEVWENFSI